MSLKEQFPSLLEKIEDQVFEVRDLVVVDENYDDIDTDEFDVFDPEEYNFLVYVTERVQEALGEERFERFLKRLEAEERFESFFAHERDMYGLKTEGMSEEDIAMLIAAIAEEEMRC
jgi:hypothetical protein